jgi:hypothetical protein
VPTDAPLELVAIHSSLYAPALFVSATQQGWANRDLSIVVAPMCLTGRTINAVMFHLARQSFPSLAGSTAGVSDARLLARR